MAASVSGDTDSVGIAVSLSDKFSSEKPPRPHTANRCAQDITETMKHRSIILTLIVVGFTLGFCYINGQEIVSARLIEKEKKDSLIFPDINITNEQIIDLKFCLCHYKYPPKLSNDIFWSKADISSKSSADKENIWYTYKFDENGKVILYHYQGSLISGILPLPYFFEYDSINSNRIKTITDVFYRNKYCINYDENNDINYIEKLDSLNNKIEILIIEKK